MLYLKVNKKRIIYYFFIVLRAKIEIQKRPAIFPRCITHSGNSRTVLKYKILNLSGAIVNVEYTGLIG